MTPMDKHTRTRAFAVHGRSLALLLLMVVASTCRAFQQVSPHVVSQSHTPITFDCKARTVGLLRSTASPPPARSVQGISSAYERIEMPTSQTNPNELWKPMIPPIWQAGIGFDETIQWTTRDDPEQVASRLLKKCTAGSSKHGGHDDAAEQQLHNARIQQVVEAMRLFRSHCETNLVEQPDQHRAFKTRIVASRGPRGTKCPQWHIDHVPVRWIQSLAGRGCQYVASKDEGINWSMLLNNGKEESGDDEDANDEFVSLSPQERNKQIVNDKVANIVQGKEMEVMLLVGSRWQEYYASPTTKSHLHPVVHKSPSPMARWEARVLLTQD
eukprot:CAMPEP_0198131702 /NCGR_PEP_ID=MMETSP1442-20131203/56753_1 /TAXON_ID= /ORGANISM="Craspedostauros australis, Strain CCMP3328" /LENGTH=326 /DNA_ID=CAMNT_0043792557 /DNA_START=28 /DNA_END=1005 /DNA_ORIENTATION=-